VLFVFQQQIFMLLYVHFGGFRVASLHRFDELSGNWAKFADVNTLPQNEVPAEQEKGFKQELKRVDGISPDGVYFVSFVDHRIRLHLLRLTATSADWEIVAEVDETANPIGLQPTMATLLDGDVFIMGGVHGCGFRWQPLSLIKVNIASGNASSIAIDSDSHKPAFCFSGSAAQAILPASHQWIHFAGRNASGMTGSVFNSEMWALRELNTPHPKWAKLVQHIPDPKTNDLHILLDTSKREDGADGEMYVVSKYLGVLKAHFRAV